MPSTDDSTDDGYVSTFDPTAKDQPSERIVTAVASLTDTDPLELTPLYEAVDPDALDSLFAHAAVAEDGHELWFSYEGFDVGVRSDGEIRVVDSAETTDASS